MSSSQLVRKLSPETQRTSVSVGVGIPQAGKWGLVQVGGSDQPAPPLGGLSGESRAEAEAEEGKGCSLPKTQNHRSGNNGPVGPICAMPPKAGVVREGPRFRCPCTRGPGQC